ncbi:MAG: hypothetical protein IT372_29465, partial [Polyangiaceae bacterium]|nr:hypothetical protein [Polyangiaceae bacterium]
MVTCPRCGTANAEDGRFCVACGAALAKGDPPAPAATVPGAQISAAVADHVVVAAPRAQDQDARPLAPTDPGEPPPGAPPLAPPAGAVPRRAPGERLPAGTVIDQ